MEDRISGGLESGRILTESDLCNHEFIRELANSARVAENREKLLEEKKFSCANWPHNCSLDLIVELCRLFGNLCFNNPKGRDLVKDLGLLSTLFTSVQNIQTHQFTNTKLIAVLPAFLQNFCIDNMDNAHLISPLLDIMSTMVVQADQVESTDSLDVLLVVLADSESGTLMFNDKVLHACVKIVTLAGPEINPDLMNALITLSEDDDKCRLFICHGLHSVLQDNLDKEVYSTEKEEDYGKSCQDLACELLVILTGCLQIQDINMTKLYSWMNGDPILCSTAFLVIGNLCTSDERTESVVNSDLLDNVIQVLHVRNDSVRHGVLSCLRNCAVNPKSRDLLVSKDIGRHLLDVSNDVEDAAMMLKVVSIIRLLSLSSESVARMVGENGTFVNRLVEMGWIQNQFSSALGQLNVETGRLFSTVIVKTQNPVIMRSILEKSGLPHLLSLLSSPHLVMLNQAVLPLCLLYTLDPLPDSLSSEVNTDVFKKILGILDIKKPVDGYKMVHENVLKLICVMINCRNQNTIDIIRSCNTKEIIEQYRSGLDLQENKEELEVIQDILNKLT